MVVWLFLIVLLVVLLLVCVVGKVVLILDRWLWWIRCLVLVVFVFLLMNLF